MQHIHMYIHGSLNVPIEHHPTTRYMVYNGYYKVMSNIPKMGQLPTPDIYIYIYIIYILYYIYIYYYIYMYIIYILYISWFINPYEYYSCFPYVYPLINPLVMIEKYQTYHDTT